MNQFYCLYVSIKGTQDYYIHLLELTLLAPLDKTVTRL